MSPQQQDSDSRTRPATRPRASTSSFPSMWRRNRPPEVTSSPVSSPAAPVHTQTLDTLLSSLTPPVVPSLANARALVVALRIHTPPLPTVMMPILKGLCGSSSPANLQTCGFDILAAYCKSINDLDMFSLTTGERLALIQQVFRSQVPSWSQEVWEARLSALTELINESGDEIAGLDVHIRDILLGWIDSAFEGILVYSAADRLDRERAVDVLANYLNTWLLKPLTSARLSDENIMTLFDFFAGLVTRALQLSGEVSKAISPPSTPLRETAQRHRKNISSVSATQLPPAEPSPPPPKHPLYVSANIYLNNLDAHLKTLPASYLSTLLPTLLRLLSACMSPLPVRMVDHKSETTRTEIPKESQELQSSLENRVNKMISNILSGEYSAISIVLLKRHLYPPSYSPYESNSAIPPSKLPSGILAEACPGAHRILRLQIRMRLDDQLDARSISNMFSSTATPSGVPGIMQSTEHLERGAQRAWKREREEGVVWNLWDARKVGGIIEDVVRSWIAWPGTENSAGFGVDNNSVVKEREKGIKEKVFEEIVGTLRDVLQHLDDCATLQAETNGDKNGQTIDVDNEERANSAGGILHELVKAVYGLKNSDGTPFTLPISRPNLAPTPFLRTLCGILARSPTRPALTPPLPITQLLIFPHLADADTKNIPEVMLELRLLNPISPDWLENWDKLLAVPSLLEPDRLATRRAVHEALCKVHEFLIDMPVYRRELTRVCFPYWKRLVKEDLTEGNSDGSVTGIWRLLVDEVVLRTFEDDDGLELPFSVAEAPCVDKLMGCIMELATQPDPLVAFDNPEESDTHSPTTRFNQPSSDTHASGTPNSPFTPITSYPPSNAGSPTLSRSVTEKAGHGRDRESSIQIPQLMSLISSFTSGGGSRAQNNHQQAIAVSPMDESTSSLPTPAIGSPLPDTTIIPNAVMAVTALIDIFTQLSFSDHFPGPKQRELAFNIFEKLLRLLRDAQSSRARLILLQCLLRLRGDRDHHVFITKDPSCNDMQVNSLASLIGRTADLARISEEKRIEEISDVNSLARAKSIMERDGRRASRGRGSKTPNATSSRSRSRATTAKPINRLWSIPETIPFTLENASKISEILVTYVPDGSGSKPVLNVSSYLEVLSDILLTHNDWEVVSYILVHLPGQLANKHFWCGPMTRKIMNSLCTELCKSVADNSFAKNIPQEQWQNGLKARDAQGLVYHVLTIMISYQQVFDMNLRHYLVEVFYGGLSNMPSTVKCCLHALSLCAYELQPSMTRALPRILEKLSQIMTNPSMAVYILAFLSIVASLPSLYANFTENDYKTAFGVALQYLQHHNRPETAAQISFALSEHVRVMSYHLVYVWFLAVKLPDRPNHVKYIARQLLLANEGRSEIDEPTEVCFDWLARYTYSSADPKPAPSLLSEFVSDAPISASGTEEHVTPQKAWVIGHSIVTIRTLAKAGWIEVVSRRASGTTKFLCKTENVPLIGLGEVDPDMTTIPASLMMDRNPEQMRTIQLPSSLTVPEVTNFDEATHRDLRTVLNPKDEDHENIPPPDAITGYVWSGSAPSQRRKIVDLDPSYFALQLSTYPDINQLTPPQKIIRDIKALARLIAVIDRAPVIDTHKVGILYVAPGQELEEEILRNTHGSPAYTRFLEGIGRLIKIRGQLDVYVGGLEPDEDGEYAYAWWNDIGQILYHTATLMPNPKDLKEQCTAKKRHIGNDFIRIVWNDSGLPYKFDTLSTQYQFINIVIEPHSYGPVAAYSNNFHENEYFKVTVQKAPDMVEFTAIGDYKIVSATSLPSMVRQLSLVADWYASVFSNTVRGTKHEEFITNWRSRLQSIKRFAATLPITTSSLDAGADIMGQEAARDFTTNY